MHSDAEEPRTANAEAAFSSAQRQHPCGMPHGLADVLAALGLPPINTEEEKQRAERPERGESSNSQPQVGDLGDIFRRVWTELGRDATHCEAHNRPSTSRETQEEAAGNSNTSQEGIFNPVRQIIEDILSRKAEAKRSQIAESTTLMMAMGFSNEQGWLTKLLELTHGNVNQVLDIINNLKQYTGGEVDSIPQIVISLFEAHSTNPEQVLSVLQSLKRSST